MPTKPAPTVVIDREYLLRIRQGIIMQLGAIEDALGMPRSIVPQHVKREQARVTDESQRQRVNGR